MSKRVPTLGHTMNAQFYLRDLSGEWPPIDQVDFVSTMYCLHYILLDKECLETFIRNLDQTVRRGGLLIGVIPSSGSIEHLLRGRGEFSNRWMSLSRSGDQEDPLTAYTFSLEGILDESRETIVDARQFQTCLASAVYTPIFHQNAWEFFTNERGLHANKARQMRCDGRYDHHSRQVVGVYDVFMLMRNEKVQE